MEFIMKSIFKRVVETVVGVAFASTAMVSWAAGMYQDIWWNSGQSGQGINVGQQGDTVIATWFTYDSNGNASWVTLTGPVTAGIVTGDLLLFTGPKQGTVYDPTKVANTKVGTAKLTFASLYDGTLEWTLNGQPGNIAIKRFSFGSGAKAGGYLGQCVGGSSCPGGVPSYAVPVASVAAFPGGDAITIRDLQVEGTSSTTICSFTGTYVNEGSIMKAKGTYSCATSSETGDWESAISFSPSGTQTVMSRRDKLTRTRGGCVILQTVTGATTVQ
jgi:hypothetical protein